MVEKSRRALGNLIPVHREGYSAIATSGIVLGVISALAYRLLPAALFRVFTFCSVTTFALLTQFFRNPTRTTPHTIKGIIAPADGTIVAIEPVVESEYFGDQRLKLSIYISIFNVHVNRVPCSGTVTYSCYHPGQYLVAFHPKASELNERNPVVIKRADGQQVLARKIAGISAQRIRYYLKNEQTVQAGSELGFIEFGSRCDVFCH
ncbi:MAG: phosphatidylserine decarboxylase [Anaerolineae bacterium]